MVAAPIKHGKTLTSMYAIIGENVRLQTVLNA